jgi:hypothetical protein
MGEMLVTQKRKQSWKQRSAGGFILNAHGMPLDGRGISALKSSYKPRKGRKKVRK